MSTTPLVYQRQDDTETPLAIYRRREYTVDEALSHVGHGWLQHLLLVIVGSSYASCSASIALTLFLMPNVRCEWELTEAEETATSLVFFLGMALGSNFWGTLADRYGRKFGTGLALSVQGVMGVMTALAPSYWILLLARSLVGLGVGGGSATPISMYSEFLQAEKRGTKLCTCQLFWALGAVTEALVAWWLLPHYGWRALTFITALPALGLVPLLMLFPESPRYLMVMGQHDRAIRVLKRVAHVNRTSLPPGTLKPPTTDDSMTPSFASQVSSLFVQPLNIVTPIVWLCAFVAGLGYYTTVLLAASIEEKSESVLCDDHRAAMHSSEYSSLVLVSLSEIPGVILALFTIEMLGRIRSMQLGWCASSTAMVFLLLFPPESMAFLFMARLFLLYTSIFIFVFTPEVYPSSCRCLALGAVSSFHRIGGAVSPFIALALYDSYGLRFVSVLCMSLFLATLVVTLCLSPFETASKALADDIQDIIDDITSNATNENLEDPLLV